MRNYAKKLNGMEIKRENGVVFMNIYEFLLDENSLRV